MSFSGADGALILNDPATQLSRTGDAPAPTLTGYASTNDIVVKVHPVVLFSVLDHYLRRPEGQVRVIGTLLGKVNANVVEVTNSFAVPHQEKNDEVAVGKDFNKQMLALSGLVNGQERIVGWYATTFDGAQVVDNSSLIHEFFTTECESPVHIVVDTSLASDTIGCRAYISSPLEIAGEALANVFHQVQVQLESSEAERICIDRMVKGQAGGVLTPDGIASVDSEAVSLESSMTRLLAMLEAASAFVDKVVAGEVPGDAQVGRKIADTLAVVPRMRPEAFAKMFDGNLQDLLMVSYLSSLTRTQLAIAEKLAI
ncbi:translation initiation factor eIF3 f subunit [Tribonema minus]|uniref:Eukaryotic translation initiation factor 3 subunit F n=1 Tax=Tribonema minus TaxID=303371 RepID=A0A835YQU3_9STRA|nr:translation initiation factor eIF3 f subunit [Tribonema minus]|eukprot:TRINITY_DN1794_c0_g1_i1.p1 TRINITY_DN1794_c0_g1~~TRINITY_DN1794_c0_g1_i1.p1  ORF type:complete len:313 (+),score=80.11 TRINITY_DN1794_c0_g1_i1:132-1070(+)